MERVQGERKVKESEGQLASRVLEVQSEQSREHLDMRAVAFITDPVPCDW